MKLFEKRNRIERLIEFLDRERDAVLKGDFKALEQIQIEKIHFFSSLDLETSDDDSVRVLRIKSESNNAMLAAAAKGIRTAIQHLEGGKGASSVLQTYDKTGNQNAHDHGSASIKRRA